MWGSIEGDTHPKCHLAKHNPEKVQVIIVLGDIKNALGCLSRNEPCWQCNFSMVVLRKARIQWRVLYCTQSIRHLLVCTRECGRVAYSRFTLNNARVKKLVQAKGSEDWSAPFYIGSLDWAYLARSKDFCNFAS